MSISSRKLSRSTALQIDYHPSRHRSLVLTAAWTLAASALPAATTWREASYGDFVDGTFSDAGANTYVSAAGRIQTVNRWDFNGDGFIDILCPNSHPLLEMLDVSIYWGNGRDYSIRRHTYVPANGPMRVTSGDFNRDGKLDLAVANYSNGTWTNMDSAVYWGNPFPATAPPAGEWDSPPFRVGSNVRPRKGGESHSPAGGAVAGNGLPQ